MNGQDFLIDQCIVSREIHGARADFHLVSAKLKDKSKGRAERMIRALS